MAMDDAVMKIAAGGVVSMIVVGHVLVVVPDREGTSLEGKRRAVFARAEYYIGGEPDHAEVSSTGTVLTTMIPAPPWAQLPPAR